MSSAAYGFYFTFTKKIEEAYLFNIAGMMLAALLINALKITKGRILVYIIFFILFKKLLVLFLLFLHLLVS